MGARTSASASRLVAEPATLGLAPALLGTALAQPVCRENRLAAIPSLHRFGESPIWLASVPNRLRGLLPRLEIQLAVTQQEREPVAESARRPAQARPGGQPSSNACNRGSPRTSGTLAWRWAAATAFPAARVPAAAACRAAAPLSTGVFFRAAGFFEAPVEPLVVALEVFVLAFEELWLADFFRVPPV